MKYFLLERVENIKFFFTIIEYIIYKILLKLKLNI